MNTPTKVVCTPICILFVCSESCFYMFGRIDWGGWRLACGEDKQDWPTRVPEVKLLFLELLQFGSASVAYVNF